jgi:hypothetical protein
MQEIQARYRRFLDAAVSWTQARLKDPAAPAPAALEASRSRLLELFEAGRPRKTSALALASPFFPATLLWQGMLASDYRFKYPPRNELSVQEVIAEKGLRHLTLLEEFRHYYPGQVLSVPLEGAPQAAALPADQWCDYCGLCCASFGGVAPMAPKEATYPAHWLDDLWQYRFWCPFLFEYHWTGKFFCSIHRIKPMWCSEFADQAVCREVKRSFGL